MLSLVPSHACVRAPDGRTRQQRCSMSRLALDSEDSEDESPVHSALPIHLQSPILRRVPIHRRSSQRRRRAPAASDWRRARDARGREYWWNYKTRETSWKPPTAGVASKIETACQLSAASPTSAAMNRLAARLRGLRERGMARGAEVEAGLGYRNRDRDRDEDGDGDRNRDDGRRSGDEDRRERRRQRRRREENEGWGTKN